MASSSSLRSCLGLSLGLACGVASAQAPADSPGRVPEAIRPTPGSPAPDEGPDDVHESPDRLADPPSPTVGAWAPTPDAAAQAGFTVASPAPVPHTEAPDDGYSPLALAYMGTSVGLVTAGIGSELCVLRWCSPRGWVASTVLMPAAASAVAGRLGKRRRVHAATATLVGMAPRTATLLTWELMAATRFRVARDEWDAPSTGLDMSFEGLIGGFMAAQVLSYGAAIVVDRTVRPSTGEVVAADAGALFVTSSTVTALYLLPARRGYSGPDYHLGRLHAGLFAATTGGLVLGGMMGRRAHMSPGRVVAIEGGALAGSGLGMLGAWFIGGDSTSARAIGVGFLLGEAGGAGLVGWLTRDLSPSPRRTPRATVQVGIEPTVGGGMLSASGTFGSGTPALSIPPADLARDHGVVVSTKSE